jgi:hypothetical protein
LAISVQDDLLRLLRDQMTVEVQVRSPVSPARLGSAVAAAVTEIRQISWPIGGTDRDWIEVNDPIPVLGGYLVMADLGNTPAEIGETIPVILARHLDRAGIGEAEIGLPAQLGSRSEIIASFRPAARAWLRLPEPATLEEHRRLAADFVGPAADWLRGQEHPGMQLSTQVISSEVAVTWATLPSVISDMLTVEDSVSVLLSDFTTAAAAAILGGLFGTVLTLGAAGRSWPAAEVAARMRSQRDLLRDYAAGAEWSGVTAEGEGEGILFAEWYDPDEPPQPMWYQILPPARLSQLGGAPPGAVELPGGRAELTVGEPEQWVPGHPDRDTIQVQAAELLTGG